MNIRNGFFLISCLVLPVVTHANCVKVINNNMLTPSLINSGYIAASWMGACNNPGCTGTLGFPGIVSLGTNNAIVPGGTLLASTLASSLTAGSSKPYAPNQILFRCQLADASKLYEIFGTNSSYELTGWYEVPDVPSAYYTAVKNVALRLTHVKSGKYFTANWQSRKLTSDDWVEDDTYIYIPARAFSDVLAEVFKTSGTAHFDASTEKTYYSYDSYGYHNISQGLLAFRGPGIENGAADGSFVGTNHAGWFSYYYPMNYNMSGVTFVRGAGCTVIDYPSVVKLPPITPDALTNGNSSKATFAINLSCDNSAVSSIAPSNNTSANVAMGFLVRQPVAVNAAKGLGLSSGSGLTYLLDNNYGAPGVASGVGIRIYGQNGNVINLLSNPITGTGNSGGWYGYKNITTSQNDSTNGITTYSGSFTASLEKIPGEKITAGTVDAQLQVIVSFQ